MQQIFEAFMIILFGLSWPINIMKSYKVRTTKGKSLLFLIFIEAGYICGIVSKLFGQNITYVLFFYILNSLMVFIDIILYARNYRLDKHAHKSF